MDSKDNSFIYAVITTAIIVALVYGSSYVFKWTGEDLKEIKKHCPEETELTDYTFGNGYYNNSQIFRIECNNKVMNYKVKVVRIWECQKYNKWELCSFNEQKYISEKIFALGGLGE